MSYRESIIMEKKPKYIFIKPKSICKDLNEWEKSILLLNKMDFAKAYKENIQAEISSHGLFLRMAEIKDIDPVYNFIITRYTKEYLEDVSRYDIFRFIEYGHGLIIEDAHQQILGCLFEVGYEKDHKKISYSIRLGVDESLKGKGLGRLLTVYSCLLAMERGMQVKIGLIDFNNFLSLHIHVNQVGWLIDSFYDNLDSLGLSFEFSLPLTPEGILANRIDLDKVQSYVAGHLEGIDYLLIRSNDIETIKTVYKNRSFKIAAIISPKQKETIPTFFALPVEMFYTK